MTPSVWRFVADVSTRSTRRRENRSDLLGRIQERAMNFLVLQHLNVEHPGIFRAFWKAAGIVDGSRA